MKSFIVDITYRVRVESEHHNSVEELDTAYDVGSRCFEDYMTQIADNIKAQWEEDPDTCNCWTIEKLEVVREATEDDMRSFKMSIQ